MTPSLAVWTTQSQEICCSSVLSCNILCCAENAKRIFANNVEMTELMHLKHFSSKVMPAWSQGWDLVAVAPVQCLSASQGAGPNTKSTQSRAVPNANTTHHRAVLNKKSTDRSVPNATSTYHRAVTSTIHSQGCTKYKIYQLLNFVTTAKITVRFGFAHCSNSREVRFWYFPSALSLEDDIRQRQWLGEEK